MLLTYSLLGGQIVQLANVFNCFQTFYFMCGGVFALTILDMQLARLCSVNVFHTVC